jgi:hypothetical protein
LIHRAIGMKAAGPDIVSLIHTYIFKALWTNGKLHKLASIQFTDSP